MNGERGNSALMNGILHGDNLPGCSRVRLAGINLWESLSSRTRTKPSRQQDAKAMDKDIRGLLPFVGVVRHNNLEPELIGLKRSKPW